MHVTLWEGRNRELRRMLGKVGLKVTHLVRTAIGPLRVEGLPAGRYRRLRESELSFARKRMAEGWEPRPVSETRPRQGARRTIGR